MDSQFIVLAILGVTVLLLITEWVPMALTGLLIPVALVAFGIIGMKDAYAVLADPLILLVTAAFVFGAAFFKVGLADSIGDFVSRIAVKYGRGSEVFVLGLVMVITGLMSSVLPNLGVVAALLPVFLSIAKTTGVAAGRILMPAAFASSMGGMLTLIGSPNNLIGRGALEAAGAGSFGFLEFAWVGLPLTALGILYVLTIGRRWLPAQGKVSVAEIPMAMAGPVKSAGGSPPIFKGNASDNVDAKVAVPMWHKVLTLAMFAVFVIAIMLENVTNIAAHLIGFVALAVLVGARVLPEKDAYKSISWSTLFFIVGILTLAGAIVSTGASDLVAHSMVQLLGDSPNPYVLTGGLFAISAALTQFMSNTATTGILAPIAISLALGMGGDPRALVMAVVLGASCAFVTAIGTPANMMVAGPGNIRFIDWFRAGWPLLVLGLVLSLVILPIIWPFY